MDIQERIKRHTHWFLRIAIAAVFLYHGLTKLPQLEVAAEFFGLSPTVFILVAMMETSGAMLVLLGGFVGTGVTRLGVIFLLPIMIGAIWLVHWPQWTFSPSQSHPLGGMEFQVTLILVMLTLAFSEDNERDLIENGIFSSVEITSDED